MSAQSKGSYEIFIYGGKVTGGTFDDIYILTIPGFRWFRVPDHYSPPRVHHACTTVGVSLGESDDDDRSTRRRQMLTSGGVSHEGEGRWGEDDPWQYALGIFDLTELVWKDEYDAKAEDYETPDMIRDWYDSEYVLTICLVFDDCIAALGRP